MQDLPTIRRACLPVARWWDDYLTTGQADPDSLDQALFDARALGPVPGRLGEALAYIIAGCLPNLNYADASEAFDRVASVGRGAIIDALDTIPTPIPVPQPGAAAACTTPGQQLAFPGIAAASTAIRNNGSSHS
jgi:hypothetical protein